MSRSTTCRARSSTRMAISDIVVCNDRFKEMYIVPQELLQPGGPIPISCAIWPRTATTARATSMRWSRKRVESLRNPTGKSFEDHTPDGRWYRILRRRAAAGGTVTVMTDITEQKQAERDLLEATRRTEEANKLITEKNRMLEALYQRNPGQEPPGGGAGGTDRRMECEGSKRASPSRWRDRADVQAHAVPLAQDQRPDHVRRCRRLAEDAPHGDHRRVRRPARLHGIHRDARSRKR